MTNDSTKTALITGATSGIGKEAAISLARSGWRVLLGARNPQRAKETIEQIHRQTGSDQVDVVDMELTSLESVRDGAELALEIAPQIDVLINNAGGVRPDRVITEDGLESTMQTNHFGHFLLTSLLLPRLLESDDARIINVSSSVYRQAGAMPVDDLNLERNWGLLRPYAIAKLANVLFTNELHRRYASEGLAAFSVHPGSVKTNFGADMRGPLTLVFALVRSFFLSPESGATPLVELTVANKRGDAGAYFSRHKREELTAHGQDAKAARDLWERSIELTGAEWRSN